MTKHNQFIAIREYNYSLPNGRIARYPLERRDASKLLVYRNARIEDTIFSKIDEFLPSGSCLFFNNTKVIHARLHFLKKTGARIEIFCLSPHQPAEYQLSFSQNSTCTWKCMVGNLKKWKSGPLVTENRIGNKLVKLTANKVGFDGNSVLIKFEWNTGMSFGEILDHIGSIPIPPYLERESEEIDNERYQTIYSRNDGSVAAPTAGLHFTPEIVKKLKEKKIELHEITLHVGAGTFQPVKSQNAMDHSMHSEFFSVDRSFIEILANTNGPIVATGTTTLRTLESLYWLAVKSSVIMKPVFMLEQWEDKTLPGDIPTKEAFKNFAEILRQEGLNSYTASTGIMIVPGYQFRVIDALITNFHQPASTLLLLVAAFIGDDWKKVYDHALQNNFRFLSYGDSSLLWP